MSEEKNNTSSIDEEDKISTIENNTSTTIENNTSTNISIKKSTYNKLIMGIITTIAIAAFFGGYSLGTNTDSGSDISSEEIKELILELDNKVANSPQPVQQPTRPTQPSLISVSLDDDPFKGNPDAKVTIVEFSDFQCPFCKRFVDQTLPSLEKEYIDTGKVKFVYRDFPLSNIHPNAQIAHVAAECADEQGEFWQYHDILFEKQALWAKQSSEDINDSLKEYASDLGLELDSFSSCLESKSLSDEVDKDYQEGAKYGTTGTPTFYIGNEKDGFVKLSGAQPFQAFKQNIDQLLAR